MKKEKMSHNERIKRRTNKQKRRALKRKQKDYMEKHNINYPICQIPSCDKQSSRMLVYTIYKETSYYEGKDADLDVHFFCQEHYKKMIAELQGHKQELFPNEDITYILEEKIPPKNLEMLPKNPGGETYSAKKKRQNRKIELVEHLIPEGCQNPNCLNSAYGNYYISENKFLRLCKSCGGKYNSSYHPNFLSDVEPYDLQTLMKQIGEEEEEIKEEEIDMDDLLQVVVRMNKKLENELKKIIIKYDGSLPTRCSVCGKNTHDQKKVTPVFVEPLNPFKFYILCQDCLFDSDSKKEIYDMAYLDILVSQEHGQVHTEYGIQDLALNAKFPNQFISALIQIKGG